MGGSLMSGMSDGGYNTPSWVTVAVIILFGLLMFTGISLIVAIESQPKEKLVKPEGFQSKAERRANCGCNHSH